MPPPLWDMLPLAAAASECWLTGSGTIKRRTNQSKRHPCTVRVHGHLTVVYGLLELGGSSCTSQPLHRLQAQHDEDAPRSFDRTFLLDGPRAFFRSRSACRDEIHRMLTRTPALRDFDLAAAHWDGGFLPDDLAGTITERARLGEEDHGGDAPRFTLEFSLAVFVRAVCSEARLLALACREATAQCGLSVADRCCCCICQELRIRISRLLRAAATTTAP